MNRAGHYLEAERLAARAVERISRTMNEAQQGLRRAARDDAHMDLRAALVHATLAAAGPGVEQEVLDQEKRAAPTQAERQAARRPLPTVLIAGEPAARPKPGPPPHTAGKERS